MTNGRKHVFERFKAKDLFDSIKNGDITRSQFIAWLEAYRNKHWGVGFTEGQGDQGKDLTKKHIPMLVKQYFNIDPNAPINEQQYFIRISSLMRLAKRIYEMGVAEGVKYEREKEQK